MTNFAGTQRSVGNVVSVHSHHQGDRSRSRLSQTGSTPAWLAIVVVVIMLAAGAAASSGTVRAASPDKYPGGGGSCPSTYTLYFSASVRTNSTNSTVSFWLTGSSPLPSASANLSWGPSTSYRYAAASNVAVGTQPSGVVKTFINYLDPGATYYYKVIGWATCSDTNGTHMYQGSYTGSWTTGSTYPSAFTGTVEDINGTVAPMYTTVYAWCNDTIGGYNWLNVGYTNSAGQYSIGNVYTACAYYGEGYHVAVLLWGKYFGYYGVNWYGRWNESYFVWAPQVVNFGLPTQTPTWIPMAAAFVHNGSAKATEGGSYYSNSKYTSNSISGVKTASSVTWAENGNFTYLPGQSVVDYGLYNVTGEVVMNALGNRTPYIDGVQYWGNQIRSIDNPTGVTDPDTIANFNPTNCAGGYMIGKPAGTWWNASQLVSGSITQKVTAGVYLEPVPGFGVGVDWGIDGPGVGIGPDISFTIVTESETVTVEHSATWGWSIHYTASNEDYSVCFDTSGPGNTEVMHIFETPA
jgi:hypothetical protein